MESTSSLPWSYLAMELTHNPYDHALLQSQRVGQGVRARRCSTDLPRRRWYASFRTKRLSSHESKGTISFSDSVSS